MRIWKRRRVCWRCRVSNKWGLTVCVCGYGVIEWRRREGVCTVWRGRGVVGREILLCLTLSLALLFSCSLTRCVAPIHPYLFIHVSACYFILHTPPMHPSYLFFSVFFTKNNITVFILILILILLTCLSKSEPLLLHLLPFVSTAHARESPSFLLHASFQKCKKTKKRLYICTLPSRNDSILYYSILTK